MVYNASDKPIEERVNFKSLDQYLKAGLIENGLGDMDYHFKVIDREGREVYRCADYSDAGSESSYSQPLFLNDPPAYEYRQDTFSGKEGLYLRFGQVYDTVDDIYFCTAGDVHLYDLHRIPPEEADGDEE